MPSTLLANFLRNAASFFGNAASSHSGLIPLKTAYKKRGEFLWAIASKKNFINLHSAAFVTVFARNLVHAYYFRIFQKKLDKFFSKFYNPEINRLQIYPASFKNIENREGF